MYWGQRDLQADGLKIGAGHRHRTDPLTAEMLGFMSLFSWLSSFHNDIYVVKFDSLDVSGIERIF